MKPTRRVARFPSSARMSARQGIRADPFPESPTIHSEVQVAVSRTPLPRRSTQPGRTRQGFAPPHLVGRVLDGTCPAAKRVPREEGEGAYRRISLENLQSLVEHTQGAGHVHTATSRANCRWRKST